MLKKNNTIKKERDDWETHWENYAESASSNPGQRMRFSLIINELEKDINKSPMRILDIGCGQGDLLEQVFKKLPQTTLAGFELSSKGVKITKEKIPTATVLVANLFFPPKKLDKFHGWATHAVCSEVLEHVDDPIHFLKKTAKYLAPNAKLIITVPGGPMSLFDKHIGHRQHFTRESIDEVLYNADFQVDKVHMAGFPFFNLYRLLVILRGKKLIEDVRKGTHGVRWLLAATVMAILQILFRLNLPNSLFGWQVFVIARCPNQDNK